MDALELVANVWPIFDADSGFVHRFLMRSYLVVGPDEAISATLRSLAATDFRLAKVYRIPASCEIVSEHGVLAGCVTLADFHRHRSIILEPALRALEHEYAHFQGLSQTHGLSGDLVGIALIPRFPQHPYLLVTCLLETLDGQLLPQLRE